LCFLPNIITRANSDEIKDEMDGKERNRFLKVLEKWLNEALDTLESHHCNNLSSSSSSSYFLMPF
jgi:hypothetical protein